VTTFDLDDYLAQKRAQVEQALERALPPVREADEDPGRLVEAMRYAVFGTGKRLRPILTLAAYEACGGKDDAVAAKAGCAIELVHCYSLVHDDLPAMDDDDMRRGRPTVHMAFNDATAVLTGDALLTLAFEQCADLCPHCLKVLAERAGWEGMIAGQARDLDLGGATPAMAALEQVHATKTGALFAAAAELGMLCATACNPKLGHHLPEKLDMAAFGTALGIAFQHVDDLEDAEHAIHAEAARQRVRELITFAISKIEVLGAAATPLIAIAERVGSRAA
jgi:geranylgeranyl pyrophosphate synthase